MPGSGRSSRRGWRTVAAMIAVAGVLAGGAAGCRSKPMRVCMNGDMDMTGDMAMTGSMNMTGDLGMSGNIVTSMRTDNRASRLTTVAVGHGDPSCGTVVILDVDGLLLNRNMNGFGSMGENPVALFREKLDRIEADPAVSAVVLRINSPGGGVTACDIMARDLREFRRRRGIPVIACLLDVGAGGAYLVAAAADRIVAHPTTIVGGLGVILNTYNLQDAMAQINVVARPVKSGRRVDAASPVRPLEAEELEMLQSLATEFHGRIRKQIHEARPAIAVAADIFDGRVVAGERAAAAGLVDRIGYLDDAIAEARGLARIGDGAATVMLRRDNDRAHTPFDVTPNSPQQAGLLPFNIPGLDRGQLPTFLSVWQPETSLAAAAGG